MSGPSFVPTVIAALHPSNISDAIELLIDILNRALEVGLLFHSEFGSCSFVRNLLLSILRI